MGPLFTTYVRSLEDTPDECLTLAAWGRLRDILKSELKRRGLWHNPPSYLGICGWSSWNPEPDRGHGGALEELVAECYSYIFVDRLGRLQAQLRAKPNIEGLILLNVRHFFLERQREHDPLGYRVYEMAQAAVRQAIDQGELFILAGDLQVRNNTVLGFAPGAQENAAVVLAPLVSRWNDELLPDLVLARGRRQEEVWARIRILLGTLEAQGIRSFRFRDFLDPLKSDTRRRWAALLEEVEEVGGRTAGSGRAVAGRRVPPENPVEARESLEKLTRFLSAALARMPTDPRTRDYLATLWRFLRIQAGDGEHPGSLEPLMAELGDEERFSHRRLAQVLGIPRERLPGLFATLRQLVLDAQALARSGHKGRELRLPSKRAVRGKPSPCSREEVQ